MASDHKHPTGGGDWYGSYFDPYSYLNIDDPESSPDDGSTVVARSYTSGTANEYYTFPQFSLPSNATNIVVRVYFRHYGTNGGSGYPSVGARIKVGTGYYAGTSYAGSATWTTRYEEWTVNPATSLAWTYSQVNALQQFGLGLNSKSDGVNQVTMAYIYASWDVSAPPSYEAGGGPGGSAHIEGISFEIGM